MKRLLFVLLLLLISMNDTNAQVVVSPQYAMESYWLGGFKAQLVNDHIYHIVNKTNEGMEKYLRNFRTGEIIGTYRQYHPNYELKFS